MRDGRPVLLERLRGGADGLPGLRGHSACGTLLATGADDAVLAAARAALATSAARAATPDTLAAVTLIGDVLVARALAPHCEPLTRTFTAVWAAVRPLVLGCVAVPPRIWHT
jgi:urease accessory protein